MKLANYTEKPDEFTHKLVEQLEKAQFNPELTTNFRGTLMAKVVFNSVVNTLCTMFEMTMGEYANYEGADEMSRQLIDEPTTFANVMVSKWLPRGRKNWTALTTLARLLTHYTTLLCIKICTTTGQLKSTTSTATWSS